MKKTELEFMYDSLDAHTCIMINERIIKKLETFNVKLKYKYNTIYAYRENFYVEWFYNQATKQYCTISGSINDKPFREDGDLNTLIKIFEMFFDYDY